MQRYEMDCGKPSPSIPYGSEAIGFHIARRRAQALTDTGGERRERARLRSRHGHSGTLPLPEFPTRPLRTCPDHRDRRTRRTGTRRTRAARCLPPSPLAGRPSPRRPGRFPSGPCGSSRSPRSDATVRAALPWRRPAATKPRQSPEKYGDFIFAAVVSPHHQSHHSPDGDADRAWAVRLRTAGESHR